MHISKETYFFTLRNMRSTYRGVRPIGTCYDDSSSGCRKSYIEDCRYEKKNVVDHCACNEARAEEAF